MKGPRDPHALLRRLAGLPSAEDGHAPADGAGAAGVGDGKHSVRILVVEDDDAISFGLRTNLSFEGYRVEVARTRAEAKQLTQSLQPALILLDLMLPDGSGFDVMRDLRATGYRGLILVLSARKEETDKVTALRMGADDYVTKPFSLAELIARVEALLRRRPTSRASEPVERPEPGPIIRFGRCEVDTVARVLRIEGAPVALTRLEFDLLAYLVTHAGQALGRGQLLRDVWGLPHDGSARTVDNVVAHLRTKIGEDADRPRHLLTLRGAGYRFELLPAEPRRR